MSLETIKAILSGVGIAAFLWVLVTLIFLL